MKTTIRITHNLAHTETRAATESLNKFLSNSEQWTYTINSVDDNGKVTYLSIYSVVPLTDENLPDVEIWRTRKEMEKALFAEYDSKYELLGAFADAEIIEEEREFGKEAA